jgi:hypothetical protein
MATESLPEELSRDRHGLGRLECEAQASSALNHSNRDAPPQESDLMLVESFR